MPIVTIGFYINFSVNTINRKIQRILSPIDSDKLLSLCWNFEISKFNPKCIFQRTVIVKVVNLFRNFEFINSRRYKNNSSMSVTKNWCR